MLFLKVIDCTEFFALFFADFCFGHDVTLNSEATVTMLTFTLRFLCTEILEKSIAPFKNKEKKSGKCLCYCEDSDLHDVLCMYCINSQICHCRVYSSIATHLNVLVGQLLLS